MNDTIACFDISSDNIDRMYEFVFLYLKLQNDSIDDMNDSIACFDISSDNIDSISVVRNLNSAIFTFNEINIFTAEGSYGTSGNICGVNCGSSNNMSGNNSCGLFCGQALEGTCGELGECLIRGCKNGGSFNSFQSLDKAKISDKFDQSGEGTGSNGNINKVTNSGGLSRCRLGCSNNDIVNDMNDTIAGSNISSDYVDGLTLVSNLNATFGSLDKTNSFSSKGLNISGGNISGFDSGSSHNMSGNDSFGLFRSKALKRTCGEFGKGFIRWSEDGGGFNSLQDFNKAKISNNFNQSGKGTCSNGNINKVTHGGGPCGNSG